LFGLYSRKIIYVWSAVIVVWIFVFLFITAFHKELGFIKEETIIIKEFENKKELVGQPPHQQLVLLQYPIERTEVKVVNNFQFFLSAKLFTKLSWLITPPLSIIFLVYLIDQIFRLVKYSIPFFLRFKKEDELFEYQNDNTYQDSEVDTNKISTSTSFPPITPRSQGNITYGERRDIPISEKIISFKIYTEKVFDEGEDAKPLISNCSEGNLIGAVFDGLGGSGGSKITSSGGITKTQAYFASRIVRDFFSDVCVSNAIDTVFAKNVLQTKLSQHMKTASSDFKFPDTQIITKRASQLPTTLAGFYLDIVKSDSAKATIFWAGDSRCYFLDQAKGLFPVTKDDQQYEADEFESLKTDSPMSNCISASGNFKININKLKLSSKTNILIAATDGCFGYFQTPMHFELMLLQTLSASSSLSLWKSNIEAQITKVTQDDATLAMVATGWSNFNEIKRAFASRLIEIETKYIKVLDEENERIISLKKELSDRQAHYNEIKLNTWRKYFSSRK